MIKRRTFYAGFAIWSAIYLIGIVVSPVSPNRFNLTPSKTHLLQLTFAIPIVFIWLAAVYGAERFKTYAQRIKSDDDGRALTIVSTGLNILVISVLVGGLVSIIRPWALREGWLKTFTIVFGYIQVLLPLIAYSFMYRGTSCLRVIASKKKEPLTAWVPAIAATLVIAIFYIYLLLNYKYRNATPDPSTYSSFYLPDYLIVLSLALPYLIGWALGIKSVMNLTFFANNVKGILYRAALKKFILGMYLIIGFAIILQILVAFSTYFAGLGLGGILFLIYLIVLFYALGFLIMANGTKKLSDIERVNE